VTSYWIISRRVGDIGGSRRSDRQGVVTCSAPKRRCRDVLIGNRADVRLVYLKCNEALIARRAAIRHERFMPRNLLHNQFEALESRNRTKGPIVITVEPRPHVVTQIVSALNMIEGAQSPSEITQPWRVNEPVRSC
jgi:gluconokinase